MKALRFGRSSRYLAAILLLPWLLGACSSGSRAAKEGELAPEGGAQGTPGAAGVATHAVRPNAPLAPQHSPSVVPPTATPSAPLAALVNGQPLYLADYERRVSLDEQAMRGLGLDLESEEGGPERERARQEVLEQLIDQMLIRQEGEARGIVLADAEVEARMQADIAAGGGQEAFEKWLQATGQTLHDYEQMTRDALISQRVMDQVMAGLPAVAEQLHLRRIVVGTEAEAAEILAQLQQGWDFGAIARERSLDLDTRDSGGDMGWRPLRLMPPDLQAEVAAREPGQISGPVRQGDRYQILQVVAHELERALAPEWHAALKMAGFREWLEAQRTAATIQYLVEP